MLFTCWCFFLIPPTGNGYLSTPVKSTTTILYQSVSSNTFDYKLCFCSSSNSAEEEQEQQHDDSNNELECKWIGLSLITSLTKSTINYHRYMKTEIAEFLEVCVPPPNA